MTKYYQYLAAGTNGSSQIRWSTPYIDGGGLGKMVSVARPVYTTVAIANRATHKQLAAVVATDVLMEELETHLGYEQVVSRLIAKSKSCPAVTLSACELQQLRYAGQDSNICDGSGTCSVCGANDLDINGVWTPIGTNTCPNEEEGVNINQRCPSTKSLGEALCENIGAIVGGAVGGFIGALVLGTIIVKFVRKQRASASKPRTSVTVEMGATAPPPTVPGAPPVYAPQGAAPPSYSHGPA